MKKKKKKSAWLDAPAWVLSEREAETSSRGREREQRNGETE